MGQNNGDGESGQRRRFGQEADEFSMMSLKFKAPADVQGERFGNAVEVRYGTQGVWTRDEHSGVSVAAVVKTMDMDEMAQGEYACLRMCRHPFSAHRHSGLR